MHVLHLVRTELILYFIRIGNGYFLKVHQGIENVSSATICPIDQFMFCV